MASVLRILVCGLISVLWCSIALKSVVGAGLIVRAVHRIVGHVLHDRWLWAITALAFAAQILEISFAVTLLVIRRDLALVVKRGPKTRHRKCTQYDRRCCRSFGMIVGGLTTLDASTSAALNPAAAAANGMSSTLNLFGSGLRSGLLTFGGAYTVIPYLQNDAVIVGGWMTNAQFLDGLALSGILPAPLVIFGTFVGYLGGGLVGAIFFGADLLSGFSALARFRVHAHWTAQLDGAFTMANTAFTVCPGWRHFPAVWSSDFTSRKEPTTNLVLLRSALIDLPAFIIFAVGLVILFRWKSKMSVPAVVLAAAVAGWLISSL